MTAQEIIKENERRNALISAPFHPISGLGSIGERRELHIEDYPIPTQWLPVEMFKVPLIRKLTKLSSIDALLRELGSSSEDYEADREKIIKTLIRIRCRYDFPFWAATFIFIKSKLGGEDVLFRLSRPQRKFVELFEKQRRAGKPIRVTLLKARQWGGSTTSQLYMAWLQLCHRQGLNSLIIAHQGTATDEIKDMFDRAISSYPVELLHRLGASYSPNEPKLVGVGKSGSIFRVPQRNCKIKIGTAERPDGCRGGDYNLVHLSEVGIWKATDGKKPEDIVRSACSGMLYAPNTMIVYESTPNGTGNFFHKEYLAAKDGKSQFSSLFIAWYEIEWNALPLGDPLEFAKLLLAGRNNRESNSEREECGAYLWSLWERGATLEAISWYIKERTKHNNHGSMASECPTDDIEAFVHSGQMVFDKYAIDRFRAGCKPPSRIGEVCGNGIKGKEALRNVRFSEDSQGHLSVWSLPEIYEDEKITERYLVSVDVGGTNAKSDYSVIAVFDRLYMMDGDAPMITAQWRGHCDIDILAWKAAQIAAFYDNALLVIEKNTIDKHDHERQRIDDNYEFILTELKDCYDNLYARTPSEDDIREGRPRKYGFHTNVSTKPVIIETLKIAIRDKLYIERDEQCLNEYSVYERKPNGSLGAVAGMHDDILMTRAIGLFVCFNKMGVPRSVRRNDKLDFLSRKAISEATI